ncbi:hypothetical protein [Marinobacter nauticus]|uniref:hypothetical protein n=1 Tax=Marinobacter nauticus TaxID=2743 RepID=UPI001C997D83|nr:hypothetical protein [Marinobacter nauticus]MBY5961940.1 hypothetical protein [Marinobacter nauticus]
MSDYTKLPRDIADCMKRAGSPLSEDQKLLLAGYLAPVQQKLAEAQEENERVRQANIHTVDVFEDMKAAKEKAEAQSEALRQELQSHLTAQYKVGVDYSEAFILRQQAEALIDAHNAMSDSFVLEATGVIQERAIIRCQDFLNNYAQRLRQQADEAERAGGEK